MISEFWLLPKLVVVILLFFGLINGMASLSLSLSLAAPELFSFASNRLITIQKAFSSGDFASLLQLPISQMAFAQMEEIQAVMLSRPLDEDNDKWVYEWGSSAFASSKIYRR